MLISYRIISKNETISQIGEKVIHVNYKKEDNYSHNRKTILFDRSAFQKIQRNVLLEVNKKYNILCPQIFVMECLAPNNTDKKEVEELEKDKRSLLEKLQLIENPIVLKGKADISYRIIADYNFEYHIILTSDQIAKNCIRSTPITMERVEPAELISSYDLLKNRLKTDIKTLNDACMAFEKSLTPGQIDSNVRRYFQEVHNITLSREGVREARRANEGSLLTQALDCAAIKALEEIAFKTVDDIISDFIVLFALTNQEPEELKDILQYGKALTVENYPILAYPIYLYYLIFYITGARQYNTEYLDQSYVRDFRYLHYLNFCDVFVTNEKSTPYIVGSLPFDNIRKTPVITVEELKKGSIKQEYATTQR